MPYLQAPTELQDLFIIYHLALLPENPIIHFRWCHHDDWVQLRMYAETGDVLVIDMLPEEMDQWRLLRERLCEAMRELWRVIKGDGDGPKAA